MRRNGMRTRLVWAPMAGLVVAAAVPAVLRGQGVAQVPVSAQVLPAAGTQSWQAVADRVNGGTAPATTSGQPTLATIVERVERVEGTDRRVVSVEYLRN